MSVAKSFFDITTGRSHGVIPTSDAVRIVLDAGATLILEKACGCEDARQRRKCACPPPPASQTLVRAEAVDRRDGELWASATGERVDQALSALVGEMVLGEAGVEVTEWTIRAPEEGGVKPARFGRIEVPWFAVDDEGAVAKKLLQVVNIARRGQGDRLHAVVVRVPGSGEVGIACLPDKPEPPVGATLTGRRSVGGTPWADVPWIQVSPSELGGRERYGLLRRAVAMLRHDCDLAEIDAGLRRPTLSLRYSDGRDSATVCIPWAAAGDDFDAARLEEAVRELTTKGVVDSPFVAPVALRVTAVRR